MGANKKLYGYYVTGEDWVPVLVDADGHLVVDASALFEDDPTDGETGKGPTSNWAYDHENDAYAHQDIGGLSGIRTLEMTEGITLVPRTDYIHQYLDTNGSSRSVILNTDNAVAGDRFVIKNTAPYNEDDYLIIWQGASVIEYIYALGMKSFIYDGVNWVNGDLATAISVDTSHNLAMGHRARAYSFGFAIGPWARADTYGVAIGYYADAHNRGMSLGAGADSSPYGVALGYSTKTNSLAFSQAIGYLSRCFRVGETSVSIAGDLNQTYNAIQGRFAKQTTNATPAYLPAAYYGGSRFKIREESVLAFRITVVGRDNIADEIAMYTFEGAIKRDNANNTTMVICNKTVVHEDDATWDCNVTADDTNEALAITVTGDANNAVRWAAVLEGIEVQF